MTFETSDCCIGWSSYFCASFFLNRPFGYLFTFSVVCSGFLPKKGSYRSFSKSWFAISSSSWTGNISGASFSAIVENKSNSGYFLSMSLSA